MTRLSESPKKIHAAPFPSLATNPSRSMEQPNIAPLPDPSATAKPSYWRKLGGGSLTISLILHSVFLALGVFWILRVIPPEPDVKFTPGGGSRGAPAGNPSQRKQQHLTRSHMPRVAARGVAETISLPEPDLVSGMGKLDALSGEGMSTSLGAHHGGNGNPSGGLGNSSLQGVKPGSGPGLFGIPTRVQRVAYVVDFSISMRADGRELLMREELDKAVKALPETTKYQLIFFSGPVWVAGDDVTGNTVRHDGKTHTWTSKSSWEWICNGPLMKADWLTATKDQIKKSRSLIKDTPLIGGTDWEAPLEIAMNMSPAPEVIIFMTDGAMEQRDMSRLSRGIVTKAKQKNITINTVNMMVTDPTAVEALTTMAERTGGSVTMVEQGGKIRKPKSNGK